MSYSSQFTEEGQQDGTEEQFLGRAIVKLEIRMESVEVKVTSLTKIIRLLQHYSEKKDLQYEKETHNMEIFDSRLNKINSMESKLGQTLSRFDELTKHFHLHSGKIEQLQKQSKDKQTVLEQLEDKANF